MTAEELPLSPRLQQVYNGMAAGLSNKEIANDLLLSVRTVESHAARVLLKTGANRFELKVKARGPSGLDPLQYRIIRSMLRGNRNKETAVELGIKPKTLSGYIWRLMQAVGVTSQPQLILWAYKHPDNIDLWPTHETKF